MVNYYESRLNDLHGKEVHCKIRLLKRMVWWREGGRMGIQRSRIKKIIKSLTMFVAWLLEESNVQKGEEDIQKTKRRQSEK